MQTLDRKNPTRRDYNNKNNEGKFYAVKNYKKNILIVSDSHGRKCGRIMKELIGEEFNISSIVKPNAKFQAVTENLKSLTKNFTTKDFVIVLAGTNDFAEKGTAEVNFNLSTLEEAAQRTNVIFPGIPLRFDTQDLNRHISRTNKILNYRLLKIAEKRSNIILLNKCIFNRDDHTIHGLHLNQKGKRKLCSLIVTSINNHIRRLVCNPTPSTVNKQHLVDVPVSSTPRHCGIQHTLSVGARDPAVDILIHQATPLTDCAHSSPAHRLSMADFPPLIPTSEYKREDSEEIIECDLSAVEVTHHEEPSGINLDLQDCYPPNYLNNCNLNFYQTRSTNPD